VGHKGRHEKVFRKYFIYANILICGDYFVAQSFAVKECDARNDAQSIGSWVT